MEDKIDSINYIWFIIDYIYLTPSIGALFP